MASHSLAEAQVDVLKPLEASLEQFRADDGGLDQLIDNLFDELDRMRQDVAGKLRALEDARSKNAQRDEALEACEAELETLRSECSGIRQQYAEAVAELATLREAWETRPASAGPPGGGALGSGLGSGDVERQALENELEMARARAAELQETVAEQQQELLQQRAELSSELRDLKEMVRRQADELAKRSAAPEPARPEPVSRPEPSRPARKRAAPRSDSDPVIDSVMAQFAKLQKDVASRRKPRT